MGAGQFVPNGAATAAFVKGCTTSLEAQRYCADVSHFVFFGFTNRDSPVRDPPPRAPLLGSKLENKACCF